MLVCVPPRPSFSISFPQYMVSASSCLSGYSTYASFPSKAVPANPVSDLPSPLDLGNCFLLAPPTYMLLQPAGHVSESNGSHEPLKVPNLRCSFFT